MWIVIEKGLGNHLYWWVLYVLHTQICLYNSWFFE